MLNDLSLLKSKEVRKSNKLNLRPTFQLAKQQNNLAHIVEQWNVIN